MSVVQQTNSIDFSSRALMEFQFLVILSNNIVWRIRVQQVLMIYCI